MPGSDEQLSELEAAVLRVFTAGNHPVHETLRSQVEAARVTKRTWDGVGFFTDFEVSPRAPRLAGWSRTISMDVAADVEGVAIGTGFVLGFSDGVIHWFEGLTYGDSWPPEARLLRCFYVRPARAFEDGYGLEECAEREMHYALNDFGEEIAQLSQATLGEKQVIYVAVRGERRPSWRPVDVVRLDHDRYRIVSEKPSNEEWEFPPGSTVRRVLRVWPRKISPTSGLYPVAIGCDQVG